MNNNNKVLFHSGHKNVSSGSTLISLNGKVEEGNTGEIKQE